MVTHRYHMTATAESHFWAALDESQERWGARRAEKYRIDFLSGLQSLAKNHTMLRATFRNVMTEGAEFRVHRLEHRYVVFQEHDEFNLIIAGIFHEKMDIPSRIGELAMMTGDEIAAIKEIIAKND
jgi:plasmid stabilization system protein ParE